MPKIKTPQQWEQELAYWRQQAADNERYWRVIRWFPAVALLGAPAAYFSVPLAGLIAVSALLTWITGYYMITVRRFEFRHNIRETEQAMQAGALARASGS